MSDGHGQSAPGKLQAYPDAGLKRFFVKTGGKVSVVLSDALRRVLPLKMVAGFSRLTLARSIYVAESSFRHCTENHAH